MSETTPDPDLPAAEELGIDAAAEWLSSLGHSRPRRWLRKQLEDGRVSGRGDPLRLSVAELWRELLRDECDKLYNQAWCTADQIRSAEDPEDVLMLVVNELPAAVEQAFSLEPEFATEHLALFRGLGEERHDLLLRELGAGTEFEADGRIECLAFWEQNDAELSSLRRNLFRLVRERLRNAPAEFCRWVRGASGR